MNIYNFDAIVVSLLYGVLFLFFQSLAIQPCCSSSVSTIFIRIYIFQNPQKDNLKKIIMLSLLPHPCASKHKHQSFPSERSKTFFPFAGEDEITSVEVLLHEPRTQQSATIANEKIPVKSSLLTYCQPSSSLFLYSLSPGP